MKIKIPWFTLIKLLGKELPEMIDDLAKARSKNSKGGTKITREEFREIFYDHMIMEIVPAIFESICKSNGLEK